VYFKKKWGLLGASIGVKMIIEDIKHSRKAKATHAFEFSCLFA